MHPVEHVIYFSVVLIHLVVPSHPLHFIFNLQHTALSPIQGHSGYDQIELTKKTKIPHFSFFFITFIIRILNVIMGSQQYP